jgi:squalene-hopene/tetraprenyl-beta-curcumene cyclase
MTPGLSSSKLHSEVHNTVTIDRARLDAVLQRATKELLAARTSQGYWVGELSSSALSTATAVTALAVVQRESQGSDFKAQIASGLEWLAQNINADGGWGDTVQSLSNISTTALCWAALGAVAGGDAQYRATVARAEGWLTKRAGATTAEMLAPALIERYGKDRTFSAPILTMCALAGRLGSGQQAWQWVIPLPFELAACPHRWFAALRLPVVSYALPALIAIGQARHVHRPARNPIIRLLRNLTRRPTLRVLERIQPVDGGFLEATPLTSFVTMSLAGSGQVNHRVTKRGVEFLKASQRPDGSWPIDTNLATWLTTLAVNALNSGAGEKPSTYSEGILPWLLKQQHRIEHPYTHSAPGGWAWTDLPGGVPDADDTAGALLALRNLGSIDERTRGAAIAGISWLLDVQNRDGGIPTFCRGWGALPFDHSSADITAHAIRAWLAWLDHLEQPLQKRLIRALGRGLTFLTNTQRADGSWTPLWFGNQFAPSEENRTYGTARVVCALSCALHHPKISPSFVTSIHASGVAWLVRSQNSDGGWGGDTGIVSSVEETALAVNALASASRTNIPGTNAALQQGLNWLVTRVESGEWTQPSPIGFYFAKLWYYERLYPLIFTVGALAAAQTISTGHFGNASRKACP